jgi:hypothetical protein
MEIDYGVIVSRMEMRDRMMQLEKFPREITLLCDLWQKCGHLWTTI